MVIQGDLLASDEQAIRDLVALWHSATASGDVDAVLSLMAEDVVFLVAGLPPTRGRRSFESGLRKLLSTHRVESTGVVQDIEVSGDMAHCWTDLTVRIVPKSGGKLATRTGNALSYGGQRCVCTRVSTRVRGVYAVVAG